MFQGVAVNLFGKLLEFGVRGQLLPATVDFLYVRALLLASVLKGVVQRHIVQCGVLQRKAAQIGAPVAGSYRLGHSLGVTSLIGRASCRERV